MFFAQLFVSATNGFREIFAFRIAFRIFANFFPRKICIVLAFFRFINFREKIQNFAKKCAKCERNFRILSRNDSFAGNPKHGL